MIATRFRYGVAPLHLAVADTDDTKCLELLLRHGADPSAKDAKGETPTDWLRDGFPAARRLLERYAERGDANSDAGR